MRTDAIFKELETLGVSEITIGVLSILHRGDKGGILLCKRIGEIITDYNSTQENENRVCELLEALCRKHFKRIKEPRKIIEKKAA